MASDEQLIYQWATSLGLTPAQAAGVLGNAQIESGFNPTSYNAGEGATGIFQWEKGRGAQPGGGLGNYAAAHGNASTTALSTQLGYATQELQGPYARALAAVKAATTPAQAALAWATDFEGNNPASDASRESAANSIYAQLASGSPMTGGGVSSNGGTGTATLTAANSFSLPGVPWGALGGPLGGLFGSGATSLGSGVAGDVAQGVEAVLDDIAAPFVKFIANGAAIVFGIILVVVALYLIASGGSPDIDVDDNASNDLPSQAPASSSGGHSGDVAAAAEAAAA